MKSEMGALHDVLGDVLTKLGALNESGRPHQDNLERINTEKSILEAQVQILRQVERLLGRGDVVESARAQDKVQQTHEKYADLLDAARDALRASVSAADSHYAHWDRRGTAGANCPACISRSEANEKARAALDRLDGKG